MDELIKLLSAISLQFQVNLERMAAIEALELAPFQARLLTVLHRYPGCSQQDLAARTGRDKAQIARTIKELEKAGLLSRAAHETNWRSFRLSLTENGQRASTILLEERAALSEQATATLTIEERQFLKSALDKIRQQLAD